MRYLVLFATILLTSCFQQEPQPVILPQGIREVMEAVETHEVLAWQGNIDGRIPVLMWYRKKNNTLSGMVVYTGNKGKQIPIFGYVKNNTHVVIQENTDRPFEVITFNVSGTSIEGKWESVVSDKWANLSMMYTDTNVIIPDFNPDNIRFRIGNLDKEH